MKVVFDLDKSLKNEVERGLPFKVATDLDWENAYIVEDTRNPYPEQRLVAYTYLKGRLHICCFTPIAGGIRVISLRKANKREEKYYEQETANR